MTQETEDELFDRLASLPLEPHERCALCQDKVGREHHALYLAILEHADDENAVAEEDPAVFAAAFKLLGLPSKDMHKRIFRELLNRRWK